MSIDRLSALDRLMLRMSGRWPQDVGALGILDGGALIDSAGGFRIEAVRRALDARLGRYPRLRQVVRFPRRGLGGPYWTDARRLDIREHVRELPLESPADETSLLAAVEAIRQRPLDPSRPLWEMWFLTGLPGGQVGWFVRIHHAIADGMAAMAMIAGLLESDPAAPAGRPGREWQPSPGPSTMQLFADGAWRRLLACLGGVAAVARLPLTVRRAAAAWPGIRELFVEPPATRTSLDRMVGSGRRFALIRGDLATFKGMGRSAGGTVNDVLLAATAAGLAAVLRHRGEPVDDTTFRVYVPVSLRRGTDGVHVGNRIAQMAVPLELGELDPRRRLSKIIAETTARKARLRTSIGAVLRGGAIGRQLLLAAVMRQRVNATTASLRGPEVPLFLAGARLLEVFPILPLVANEPIGVAALSYAGALTIGVTVDRDAVPDLDVLVEGMRDELRRLTAEAGQIPAAAERVGVTWSGVSP